MRWPHAPPKESRTTTRPFDDEHAPLYTVGQVADMLGVQPAFLRRLDTEAVVQPARSEGGQRRYSQLEILLVEKVVGLTTEGLTLAGIRRLLILEDQVRDLQRQLEDEQNNRRAGPARKEKG
jgi:DNA-binding transcriptional MerR regulator